MKYDPNDLLVSAMWVINTLKTHPITAVRESITEFVPGPNPIDIFRVTGAARTRQRALLLLADTTTRRNGQWR
ncbi:hypothetical protein ACSDR0_23465 [Streptosporangium sp. G11]|uniref:hypothetical protein n=1 Tax=Streptosporangium sp. G11 TaxID=3436926 RepID=UPI003EB83128